MTQPETTSMSKLIMEYAKAVEAHMVAIEDEHNAKLLTQKTHYDLMKARDALRNMERDILSKA